MKPHEFLELIDEFEYDTLESKRYASAEPMLKRVLADLKTYYRDNKVFVDFCDCDVDAKDNCEDCECGLAWIEE